LTGSGTCGEGPRPCPAPVLPKICAHGQADAANKRITDAAAGSQNGQEDTGQQDGGEQRPAAPRLIDVAKIETGYW
jgi:hypothetical protein